MGIKECNFSGDAGFRVLAHYLGQLPLQVLAVEQCGLTDTSLVYIASIIKVFRIIIIVVAIDIVLLLLVHEPQHTSVCLTFLPSLSDLHHAGSAEQLGLPLLECNSARRSQPAR